MSRLMMNRNLATVEKWYDTAFNSDMTALQYALHDCDIFTHIWIPVKAVTVDGMQDVTYQDIGVRVEDLSLLYATLFKENYIISDYNAINNTISDLSATDLHRRILSVYKLNFGKYLKLIELAGYEYNPLWNVDGVEEFSYLENSGTNDTMIKHNYAEHRVDTHRNIAGHTDNVNGDTTRSGNTTLAKLEHKTNKVTTKVAPFDSEDFKNYSEVEDNNYTDDNTDNKETTTYNDVTDDFHNTLTYGTQVSDDNTKHNAREDYDNTTITHHNADNNGNDYLGGTDTFGNTVVGGDKYHTERKVRSGNIGVTKTQELIESERENLKFNIIYEFFKDINEQILVGIY